MLETCNKWESQKLPVVLSSLNVNDITESIALGNEYLFTPNS